MDSLVFFTVVIRTVFFRSGEGKIISNQLWALNPQLVLDGIEDFIDRSLNRVKCSSILKAWSGFGERTENTCVL